MPRLVVVSNRVADPRRSAAGGLAVAVADALRASGGLWFGWSGRTVETAEEVRLHRQRAGEVSLVTMDLPRAEHEAHYLRYSNAVLWPLLHFRLDLAELDGGGFEGYRAVNRRMAEHLAPLLLPDDIIWVHDFHLIPFAAEMRALGAAQRIGFFLHVPLPPPALLAALPEAPWLVEALASFDLVGFQTSADLDHFTAFLTGEAGGHHEGDGTFSAYGRRFAAAAIPIGIDVDEFRALGSGAEARETRAMMRAQYAHRDVLVGVDRLDYSKGLPHRIRAFRRLLERHPEWRQRATLIQIAAPSREEVDAYADIRAELESLCGMINGAFGELDWMPVRYLRRAIARRRLPGLYAASRAALVTPLRDGMNLVAKEYVASQDESDPGVLVLSRFAGAAEQLREAVLVNPYDIDGTADAIDAALRMPLAERRERHARLLQRIREQDVHWWSRTFLDRLARAD